MSKPLRFTLFQSVQDRAATTHELPWEAIAAQIANPPTYQFKEACPLIKLAVFSNAPSSKGFLRHDGNVLAVTGVEGDHDSKRGVVSVAEVVSRLRRAGLRCVVYTSASHTPERPRWRVLAPLSCEYPPEYRRAFLTFLDGLCGDVLERESYTLSQSYFVGRVEGVEYEAVAIEGRYLDELTEPVAAPLDHAVAVDVPEWRHVDVDSLPIPDDAKALVREGAPRGERSEALMKAANALARARVDPDDILRVLSDPAYEISAKALDGRRQTAAMEWLAKHTVRKALEAHPPLDAPPAQFGPAAQRQGLLISAADFANDPAEPSWLIEGIVETGVFGVVFGAPGVGKSFLSLDWAACVAAGVPWNGRAVTAGGVVYVAGEGFGGLARRLQAWSRYRGTPIPKRLHVTRRAVAFNDPQAVGALHAELDALPERPAALFIDTLSRATPGVDQNSAKEIGAFVGACDRIREKYGCAVIVLHHSGHGSKERAMGSMALLGACDFEAGLIADGELLRLKSTKMKDAEPFADIGFHMETVELPPVGRDLNKMPKRRTSAVLVERDAPPKPPPPDSDRVRLLKEVVRTHGKPIHIDEAQAIYVRLRNSTPAASVKAFQRALKDAVPGGAIIYDRTTDLLSMPDT